MVIAPLQRIAATAKDIHARAACHERIETLAVGIEFAFEPTLPGPPLVQLIEHHEGGVGRQRASRMVRRSSRLSHDK